MSHSCSSLSCHQTCTYLIWMFILYVSMPWQWKPSYCWKPCALRNWILSAAVYPVRTAFSLNVVPWVRSMAYRMQTSSTENLKPHYWWHRSYCWWLLSLDPFRILLVPAALELREWQQCWEILRKKKTKTHRYQRRKRYIFFQKKNHVKLIFNIQAIFPNFTLLVQVIPISFFLTFLYSMFQHGAGRSIRWNAEWLDTFDITCFNDLWAFQSNTVRLLLTLIYRTFTRIIVN